ncbi:MULTISPECIES: protoporphyrinogen/coproporphyrinogen oxidase [Mycobacterium]|uniref:Amine oxidase domain-containing protein n=1 Tax=Mycobacterium kiyosense TaxID=2871094 RepID=A0A9P3UXS6_9MYCO|nr:MULTISPECIES: NAD(P)/FAD-dependent oxidoreductase [Mycobacterium]BDB43858.1 hypothetical protein IWGMT90018_43040 [Mycobacterium kiyosense]BDE15414.1 hypothetical protein MKCMC460_42740 [Mycobacterium sp. 20KCMC460]GLB82698.1 hypothetical protein SRL2020028_19540 [Mycobacterium kiyosense]GLB90161.1 hypothetical protein SRL2020130_29780 [Mycobacterium kiyosense]GLB95750.1 hypothetical protein SRL2020226_25260 [Mycobacterium kiyosense]
MTDTHPRAAVVGGGIAGLTAALRLKQAGWQVVVLEAADHAGGRVETIKDQGYIVDTGATAIAARYPIFTALAEELGCEIVSTAPYLGVVRDGRIHSLKLDDLVRSGLRTKLLSWPTKLRMTRLVAEIVTAKARGRLDYDNLSKAAILDDETAQSYVRRVAGAEADQFFAEPVTRALLLANSDQVSRVELMSGLINAVAGTLGTTIGGQADIINRMVDRIGEVRTSSPVDQVAKTAAGVLISYRDASGEPRVEEFDAAVVATPLPVAARICPDHRARLELFAAKLTFTRGINVAIGSTRAPSDPSFLVQLPRSEDRNIAMIIVENRKAPDRAPAGHGLFTISWEMSAAAAWFDATDDAIIERSVETLRRLFPDLGEIDYTYVRRWPIALPHTQQGVYRAIGDFVAGIDESDPIQFAGDYLSQTGQNTAVAWGERAAANLAMRRSMGRSRRLPAEATNADPEGIGA